MAHDYKQEIRDWFKDDHLNDSISDDYLFIALDADPEYWECRRAFKKAVEEMIESGELDTYGGQLQFNPTEGG